MADPFNTIATPASNDELTAMFRGLVPQTPFNSSGLVDPTQQNPNANRQVSGGTKAGIDRVNANSDQTGVAGYRDANGRAVFTQVRDSSTGQTIQPQADAQGKQIPALFKPFGTSEADKKNAALRMPDISTGIQNALEQIKLAKDYSQAAGIYTSFQETISAERARLEQEAFSLAEQKLGIPAIMAKLEQTRAADRASFGWYQGIGDSPITQKVLAELMQARQFVNDEAKNFLTQNVTYKSLANYENQGKMYLNHVDKILSAEDRRKEQNTLWKDQALFNNALRDQDRAERDKEELLKIHEGMTTNQIANLNILEKEKLAAFDVTDPAAATMKKLKEASLWRGRTKDKQLEQAVSAETNQQLLALAVQGNSKAKVLLLAKEANVMGINPLKVEEQIRDFEKILRSKTLVQDTLSLTNDKDAKKKQADFNAAAFASTGKPEEIAKINNERIGYALAYLQHKKTQEFNSDVRSWNVMDPLVANAAAKAVSSMGSASIENVVATYLDGSKDRVERATRLQDFARIMRISATKQANSAFGMPDYRAAEVLINQRLAKELSGSVSGIGPLSDPASLVQFASGEINQALGSSEIGPFSNPLALAGYVGKEAYNAVAPKVKSLFTSNK